MYKVLWDKVLNFYSRIRPNSAKLLFYELQHTVGHCMLQLYLDQRLQSNFNLLCSFFSLINNWLIN